MELFDTIVTDEAKRLVNQVLDSRHLSEGRMVQQFEDRLTQMFGYDYPVAVNSCTSALHLALILSGVGHGDEVILPAQTFVATAHTIMYQGAKPVFADIDPNTGNLDVQSIIDNLSTKTKAVICVAWGGQCGELMTISAICEKYGLKLIQDNAHALGSSYNDLPLSEYSDFSCYSFQAIKQLTTGDGGLLVCNNRPAWERARRLRWFDIDRDQNLPDHTGERLYNLKEIGYKYHMNDVAAALGLGNLTGFWERNERRRKIVQYYDEFIRRVDISFTYHGNSTNWLYTINVPERDRFIAKMWERNIPVSVVHVGIDRNDLFGGIRKELRGQRYFDKHHVCIPCHSSLTDEEVDYIVENINYGW